MSNDAESWQKYYLMSNAFKLCPSILSRFITFLHFLTLAAWVPQKNKFLYCVLFAGPPTSIHKWVCDTNQKRKKFSYATTKKKLFIITFLPSFVSHKAKNKEIFFGSSQFQFFLHRHRQVFFCIIFLLETAKAW
jgi:hypothetical protein